MPDALSGPELDAEIARRVFGREVGRYGDAYLTFAPDAGPREDGEDLRPYSTDIAAAWEVVEAMHARGDCASIIYRAGNNGESFEHLSWFVEFRISNGWATSASLPEAICRAALAALEGSE